MNNMKHKKYHTVGAIPKSNIKIVERGKIDIPNTRIVIHESLEQFIQQIKWHFMLWFQNFQKNMQKKMKNKKYHIVRTVQKV